MPRYDDLVAEALTRVTEIMPWDLSRLLAAGNRPLLLDVREPAEFEMLRIPGAINVPRGVLEQSCEWGYDETLPLLAAGREQEIVVICRSGKRSVLAADVLLRMGYSNVVSLKTGCAAGTITSSRWKRPQAIFWMRIAPTNCSRRACARNNVNLMKLNFELFIDSRGPGADSISLSFFETLDFYRLNSRVDYRATQAHCTLIHDH
jgi:rhodanese-related sulfurtransferase